MKPVSNGYNETRKMKNILFFWLVANIIFWILIGFFWNEVLELNIGTWYLIFGYPNIGILISFLSLLVVLVYGMAKSKSKSL